MSDSFNPLSEYRSQNIKLELPRNRSLTEFNWISVYSRSDDEDLGHVTLPRQLNVPPAMKLMVRRKSHGLLPKIIKSVFFFFPVRTMCTVFILEKEAEKRHLSE
jgi:hypothetical protein